MPHGSSFAKRVRGSSSLARPAAGGTRGAPRLPRPRPSSASRAGAPRCPQEAASPTPRRGPHAGSPRSREAWPLAPAWRFETPTLRLETLKPGSGGSVAGPLERFNRQRGDGGELHPAGGWSHDAGACGHRAGAPQWGIAGAVSGEQRGAPPRDVPARSHAKAGRRAALDAQPERPGSEPAGQKKPHAVKQKNGSRTRRAKKNPPRSGKKKPPPSPRGKRNPTEWQNTQRPHTRRARKKLHAARRKAPVRADGAGVARSAGGRASRAR